MSIDRKYIVSLQGKEFITFPGLVSLAHDKGLQSIKSEMVSQSWDKEHIVFKSTAVFLVEEDQLGEKVLVQKTFTAHGDASPDNCGKMVAQHYIRLADTRAHCRVLRIALNIDLTAAEEMGDNKPVEEHDAICKTCGSVVIQDVKEYSIRKYGKVLCREHQKTIDRDNAPDVTH